MSFTPSYEPRPSDGPACCSSPGDGGRRMVGEGGRVSVAAHALPALFVVAAAAAADADACPMFVRYLKKPAARLLPRSSHVSSS